MPARCIAVGQSTVQEADQGQLSLQGLSALGCVAIGGLLKAEVSGAPPAAVSFSAISVRSLKRDSALEVHQVRDADAEQCGQEHEAEDQAQGPKLLA